MAPLAKKDRLEDPYTCIRTLKRRVQFSNTVTEYRFTSGTVNRYRCGLEIKPERILFTPVRVKQHTSSNRNQVNWCCTISGKDKDIVWFDALVWYLSSLHNKFSLRIYETECMKHATLHYAAALVFRRPRTSNQFRANPYYLHMVHCRTKILFENVSREKKTRSKFFVLNRNLGLSFLIKRIMPAYTYISNYLRPLYI